MPVENSAPLQPQRSFHKRIPIPPPTLKLRLHCPGSVNGECIHFRSRDTEVLSPLSCFSAGACTGRSLDLADILSPICIGPLVPEPVHTVNANPRPILEKVSTVTSHETNQAKPGPSVQTTTDEAEDDIMTINTCGHSFHSKCLSSWFLIERYDCPVCRVPYYQGIPRRETALSVTPFW